MEKMNEANKQFNERRIWYFTCDKCGKTHRQSHKKKNARNHICMKCRKLEVPENQPPLFTANGTDEVQYFQSKTYEFKDGDKAPYPKIIKIIYPYELQKQIKTSEKNDEQ